MYNENYKESNNLELDSFSNEEIDIQFAENTQVLQDNNEGHPSSEDNEGHPSSEEKRDALKKTKIVKQTWSIQEIYQKIKMNKIDLSPRYQRNDIWKHDKQTAFIESLFMGIIVPPIYVVEVPGQNVLDGSMYEIVDGKQRLTTINNFLTNKLTLNRKSLEYYKDWFGQKEFLDIQKDYVELSSEMLSSVLDIYVITANSPEFTKYDIFARLNKGSEKLKVNEIRKAIYRSPLLEKIETFVNSYLESDSKEKVLDYKKLFSENDIKRYEDYGRFYTSVAFYIQSDVQRCQVNNYNSRPREMINSVLQSIQDGRHDLKIEDLDEILNSTIELKKELKEIIGHDYIISSCIPFCIDNKKALFEALPTIKKHEGILTTLQKSPATTSNVNTRLVLIKEMLNL